MMLPIYVVSSSDFIEVPNKNTFAIFYLTTDNTFYAKLNVNDVISIVALGGGDLTSFLYNNIDVTESQNHVNEATELEAIQTIGDNVIVSMSYPNLTTLTTLSIVEANALQELLLPQLSGVKTINIEGTQRLPLLSIPSLEQVSGNINIQENIQLASVDLSALIDVGAILSIENNTSLVEVDISGFVGETSSITSHYLRIKDNSQLTSILISDGIIQATRIDFSSNALANIDQILSFIRNSGTINGNLNLSGGTNAAPTGGAGNADVLALQAAGWTVSHN